MKKNIALIALFSVAAVSSMVLNADCANGTCGRRNSAVATVKPTNKLCKCTPSCNHPDHKNVCCKCSGRKAYKK